MRARKRKAYINLLDKLIIEVQELQKKTVTRLRNRLTEIAEHAVTDWYESYDSQRHIYEPYGSLYKAYNIEVDDNCNYSVEFSPEFMAGIPHHQKNEIIFNNAFIFGFHGGSAGKDKIDDAPWLRTPYPFFEDWLGPATFTFSPYERIYAEMDEELQEIKKELKERERNMIERLTPYLK